MSSLLCGVPGKGLTFVIFFPQGLGNLFPPPKKKVPLPVCLFYFVCLGCRFTNKEQQSHLSLYKLVTVSTLGDDHGSVPGGRLVPPPHTR